MRVRAINWVGESDNSPVTDLIVGTKTSSDFSLVSGDGIATFEAMVMVQVDVDA